METEEFRQWNQKMIHESAKMIKLVLVLLIGWTFITIGWIVHLIVLESSRPPEAYLRFTRGEPDVPIKAQIYPTPKPKLFEELAFYTTVDDLESEIDWKRIKMIIGGFHQLKSDSGLVPFLTIYTKKPLDAEKHLESLPWNKVEFKVIFDSSHFVKEGAIWMSSDFTFDPIALDLRKADLLDETEEFKEAFAKGRRLIEEIGNEECLDLIDPVTRLIVLKTPCDSPSIKTSSLFSNVYGLMRIEKASKSIECHVDLKGDILANGAELVDFTDILELEKLGNRRDGGKKKLLAIAAPSTSKGMTRGEKHVLLSTLVPSLNSTLTASELKQFEVVLFVGFDRGDEYFERRASWELRREIEEYGIKIIFLRLEPFRRVAMTWNMIFQFIRKHVRFDYYYQVNDDLKMITPGWITKFTEALESVGNIGVAGPSDNFNGFACSLLTQSFVADRHFQIFNGSFYPLEFRDWKSDRWLSFVYGPGRTFCWNQVEADNGAKGTRYAACPFSEWKIYLEKGQNCIKKYLHE